MQRFTPAWERRRLGRQRGVRLFVLPPRPPQLNGRVERANRTHTEEFYEITPGSLPITQLNQELLDGERTYNTVLPTRHSVISLPRSFWLETHLNKRT